MAEYILLNSPETKPINPIYTLATLTLSFQGNYIRADLVGANGETLSKTYDGGTVPRGETLLHSVITGNFSGATSLVNAVYTRLIADGVVIGTVTGSVL